MKTKEVISYIVNWLDNYLEKSGMNGFVIGISGGIDSAVVSILAAKTGKPVLLLDLPIHQEEKQASRADEHIKSVKEKFINVKSYKINLSETFDIFKKETSISNDIDRIKKIDDHMLNLSLANSRSRLRMTTLYQFAGLYKYLVIGTGNKIEDFGVGFYTKYGDGGVDISPIADLLKTQIFEIAQELNILQSIQKAKPTDGLWDDDRSDEDQMGASYPELEWAMSVYKKKSANDFSGRQKEIFLIYDRLNKAAQHKIKPIPVCEIPKDLLK